MGNILRLDLDAAGDGGTRPITASRIQPMCKSKIIAFEVTLVLSLAALLCLTESSVAQSKAPKDAVGGSAAQGKEPTPFVADDCPPATKYDGGGADGSTRYCVFFEQRALKRCETSYFNYLTRDSDFTVNFDFRLDQENWDFHNVFTSIFQIHSMPDPGEQWRCPIAMMAVQGHSLEMWDRDDQTQISKGVCSSDSGSSITTREVFSDIPVAAGEWNHFDLQAKLSLGPSGTFIAKLNNKPVGNLSGPNTYNDQSRPYIKIGIYKPSTWENAKRLCVDYRNVGIKSGSGTYVDAVRP